MRSLIYHVAVSLDGFIAGPGGRTEDFLSEGDHIGWLLEELPETIPGHVRGAVGLADVPPRRFDTVVMGRRTHQVAIDAGLTSGYPHLRQLVVTNSPETLPDDPTVVTTDDPLGAVERLESEDSPHNIWLCGGGELAGRLLPLIDEVWLKINPVVLGAGVPLFGAVAGEQAPARTTLLRSRCFDSGVIAVAYVL